MPVIALVISLVFRILLLILLAKNPAINVFAVSISNIVFLSFATIICLLFLKREIALNFSKKSFLIFPVMAVAISSVISYGLKIFLANYLSELIYSIISGSIGIIVYIVLILSFNIFNEKEAEMIPFSKKIFKRLRA